ncbi:MFS transporter [Sporolactobacillus kofuensis]|uniref:MFS transporter n=1 Tax=Sporolactobacillus kofuensis TaxID=269672 RepID=A0ABW1WHI4_9BACL|nr:MFS transporter [Sporolactobacillus kofuensis]MCO7176651.1 MFS transporter [Sporolactobacillus kofuensis]
MMQSKCKIPQILLPVYQSQAFRSLWIGNTFSNFGSSITGVIIPLLVYSLSQSTVAMGLIMTAYMLPNVLMLPFAGVIVDKYNRAKIMRLTDFIQGFIALTIMSLALTHLLTIQLLIIFAVMLGLCSGLFQPAFSAMRASVFTPDIRTSANALNQLSVQGMRLIGPAIGGMIVALWSAPVGFGIDALTFFISFICLLFLTKEGEINKNVKTETEKSSLFKESLGGIRVIKNNTWLWVTILAFCFINICTSGVIVILIPWLLNVHDHFPSYVYGFVMSGEAVGSALAAFIFGMRKTWRYRGIIAYLGVGIGVAAFLIMPFVHSPVVISLLMTLEGLGSMIFGLIWETSLQEFVEPESFGRVASLDMLGSFALLPVGYLFTGWFASMIGGISAMVVLSMSGLFMIAICLFIPAIRNYD